MWKNFTIVLLLICYIGLAWSDPIIDYVCPGHMTPLSYQDGVLRCPPTTERPFVFNSAY
uniref:Chemokine isoform 2 n=1 Tax=Mythimna separata TaxID=271217 RepID=B7XBB1_MYTSE|nr:chemokine isoform 2 [Mythimna separata]